MTTSSLHDSLFLKACRREPVARTPVWLMRQAGRYMKKYRDLREKVPFMELCKNSDLAADVAAEAAQRLDVDAAILFSDILLIVEPLGFRLSYEKNDGPVIGNPFRSEKDLNGGAIEEVVGRLSFVRDAVRKCRAALPPDRPLIGFSGAPFTIASYLIEGQSSRTFLKTKALMATEPDSWRVLMTTLTKALTAYLNDQIDAGVQAVQIFDSWVGCLSPDAYRDAVFPYSRDLINGVKAGVPVVHFATQHGGLLSSFRETGGDVIGLDWRVDLKEAWSRLGGRYAVMGNLDPAVLLTDKKTIKKNVDRILKSVKGRPGHIFNLGHGVLPQTPEENVRYLVQCVKERELVS